MFTMPFQIFLGICCFVLGGFWGDNFRQGDILEYAKNIKDQGIAIFTIFGIWIALIFPEELKKLKENKLANTELSSVRERFDNELIIPLLIGTFSIVFCLAFDLVVPFIRRLILDYPVCRYYVFWSGKSLILFAYANQIMSLGYSIPIILGIKWEFLGSAKKKEVENSLPPIQD